MGVFADEEWKTTNEAEINYLNKINSRFKLFAQGATFIECIHSNISPHLIKCEICDDSHINFVFVLKNQGGNTIKCGTRCAQKQKAVEIKNLRPWFLHLKEQIDKEEQKINEIRSSKKTIIKKKAKSDTPSEEQS